MIKCIILLIIFIQISTELMEKIDNNFPYKNPSLPIEERLNDLIPATCSTSMELLSKKRE